MKFKVVVKNTSKRSAQKILESYCIDFTNEELMEEEWVCFDQIPQHFKPYMDMCNTCTIGKEKMLYSYHDYYISTLGRIGILQDDGTIILKGVTHSKSNRYLNVSIGKIKYRVNRLMGFVFLENTDPKNKVEVNHLNEVVYDNRVHNLEWVTPKENTNWGTGIARKAILNSYNGGCKHTDVFKQKFKQYSEKMIDAAKKSVCRPIICTDLKTGEVKQYESCRDAARNIGCTAASINDCCRGKIASFRGYTFIYADGRPVRNNRSKSIVQLTPLDAHVVKVFKNIQAVSAAGFSTMYIRKCCLNKGKITCGFQWRYLDDYNNELQSKGLDPLKIDED